MLLIAQSLLCTGGGLSLAASAALTQYEVLVVLSVGICTPMARMRAICSGGIIAAIGMCRWLVISHNPALTWPASADTGIVATAITTPARKIEMRDSIIRSSLAVSRGPSESNLRMRGWGCKDSLQLWDRMVVTGAP